MDPEQQTSIAVNRPAKPAAAESGRAKWSVVLSLHEYRERPRGLISRQLDSRPSGCDLDLADECRLERVAVNKVVGDDQLLDSCRLQIILRLISFDTRRLVRGVGKDKGIGQMRRMTDFCDHLGKRPHVKGDQVKVRGDRVNGVGQLIQQIGWPIRARNHLIHRHHTQPGFNALNHNFARITGRVDRMEPGYVGLDASQVCQTWIGKVSVNQQNLFRLSPSPSRQANGDRRTAFTTPR